MKDHPSIFELSRFIEGGIECDAFDAHVSACDACSMQLARLAHRSMISRGLSAQVVVPSSHRVSPALASFVALTACLTALMAQPSRAAMTPYTSATTMLAPEGLHGTPFTERELARFELTTFTDAGLMSPAP
jgi:hypothetical protein